MFCVGRTGLVPNVLSKSKQGTVGDSVIRGVFGDGCRVVKRNYILQGLKKRIYNYEQ